MRIYQNLGIVDEMDLPKGTIGLQFRITGAKLVKRVYDNNPGLALELRQPEEGYCCGYSVIGSDLIRQFGRELRISKVKELIGKNILGFLPPHRNILQGLAAINSF